MRTATEKPYIKNPDTWDVYERPTDNLLYAVLVRAVNDCLGYYQNNRYHNGENACEWVKTEGYKIYLHLRHAPKKGRIDSHNGTYNMENRQLNINEIAELYRNKIFKK